MTISINIAKILLSFFILSTGPKNKFHSKLFSLVACSRLYICPSVGRSSFTFLYEVIPWPHCSNPNGQVTSNMVPAYPHAIGVAMSPALLKVLSHRYWCRTYTVIMVVGVIALHFCTFSTLFNIPQVLWEKSYFSSCSRFCSSFSTTSTF